MMKDEEKTGLHQSGGRERGDHRDTPTPPVEKEEEEEDTSKSSICCLQGCLAATAVGFSFFVALPTGILLVVYASNKDDVPLISVGAVLIALPLIMLIVVIVLCFNQRRLARLGKNRVTTSTTSIASTSTTASQKKQKLASSSSLSSSSSSSSSQASAMTTIMATTTVTMAREGEKQGEKVAGRGVEKGRY